MAMHFSLLTHLKSALNLFVKMLSHSGAHIEDSAQTAHVSLHCFFRLQSKHLE